MTAHLYLQDLQTRRELPSTISRDSCFRFPCFLLRAYYLIIWADIHYYTSRTLLDLSSDDFFAFGARVARVRKGIALKLQVRRQSESLTVQPTTIVSESPFTALVQLTSFPFSHRSGPFDRQPESHLPFYRFCKECTNTASRWHGWNLGTKKATRSLVPSKAAIRGGSIR